jgi:DNA modification methylase
MADDYDPTADVWASYGAAQDALRARHEAIMAAGAKRIKYFGHAGNDAVLIEGDCREVLPALGMVDAVVTDPPYCSGGFSESGKQAVKGMGLRSETIRELGWFVNDNMTTAGLCWLMSHVAGWSRRCLKKGGTFTAFTDWRMAGALAPAIEAAGFRYQNLIVWAKPSAGLGSGFRAQHELAIHFSNGTPEYFSSSNGNVLFSRRVHSSEREHQTEKPVELIASIVETVSPFGGIVLDPFMGSGTTGVAALQLGRKFIGIELDPGYFDIACKRISEAWAQPRLFDEPRAKPAPAPSLFDSITQP